MAEFYPIPEEGEPAPFFTGITQENKPISSDQFKGKKLALYFYPRDNTSVCTVQACNIRDHYSELIKAGISIVGVSDDPVDKHVHFANKNSLPFPLIADTEQIVLKAYGAHGEKSMYGRKYMGTKRMTFLIDENGLIKKVIIKPKSKIHASEILNGFGL